MIPSHPLNLSEIVSETVRIYIRAFPRYALLFLLLFLPGAALVTVGISNLGTDTITTAQRGLHLSDSDATIIRNDFRRSLSEGNPFLSAEERVLLQDSLSMPSDTNGVELHPQTRQLVSFFQKNRAGFVKPFFNLALGGLLFVLGLFTLIASSIDLSCQVFEERPHEPMYALWASLRGNTWKILWVYILYAFLVIIVNLTISIFPIQVSGILAFFVLIAQIYLLVRLVAVFPSMVSEELSPFDGVRRSWQLTRHLGWRIFAFSIAFGLVLFFLSIIASEITGLLFPNIASWIKELLIRSPIPTQWLLDTFPGILWSVVAELSLFTFLLFFFLPAFLTVLYYDLRTRHDGPLVYLDETTP